MPYILDQINISLTKSCIFCNLSIGPELPIPLVWHSMIEYGNDLIVMGGFSENSPVKSIYRISCELWSCEWTKMKQTLSYDRASFVSIPLPHSIVTCN